MDEYTDTVEITEISDPTPEEEAAVRAAHGTENSPEEDGEHGDEDGSEIYRGDEEPEEDWIRHFHLKIENRVLSPLFWKYSEKGWSENILWQFIARLVNFVIKMAY